MLDRTDFADIMCMAKDPPIVRVIAGGMLIRLQLNSLSLNAHTLTG